MAKIAIVRFPLFSWLLSFLPVFLFLSCSDDQTPAGPQDTLGKGSITISVDETFQPVIDEQLRVFDSIFPEAHITVNYKPEAECIQDLLHKRARLVLVTRGLSGKEHEYLGQNKLVSDSMAVASDAIAVIVSKNSPDSLIGAEMLKGLLSGQYKEGYNVVVDHNGSSMLRFLRDSVLKGAPLGSNVFAAGSSDSVISYVARNPKAIGFIGLAHVSTEADPLAGSFTDQVTIAAVENAADHQFYKPLQYALAQKLYPLTRKLFYIKAETFAGLGRGFTNFLIGEQGQLIFRTHHLFPLRMTVNIREVNLN